MIPVAGKGVIRYYYDANGNKLQKRTIDNTTSPAKTTVTTYIGGAVYLNDTLQFFGTPEGRVRVNTAKTFWIYDYFLKDHLGNTRMMITDDYNVSSPILEANSYYPFGLQQKCIGLAANSPIHNFMNTFQKQEFNEDLDIDLYEFKYRMDDPQIGRFWQIDPLADKYVYNSTYAFSENKLTGGIELEGAEYLRTVNKFQYNGSLSDIPSAVDNGAINLVNSVISLYNAGVSTVMSISNGTYGKDLGNGFKAIGNSVYGEISNSVNYTINTPIGQQLSDVGNAIVSPETLEFASSFVLGGAIGKVAEGASSIGNFSLKSLSTEAVNSDAGANGFSLSAAKTAASVTEQAATLSKQIGENSISIKTPNKTLHFDFQGATHKGVPTPHIQQSLPNVNPKTGQIFWNKDRQWVKPMTQQDIRIIRNYLKRQ